MVVSSILLCGLSDMAFEVSVGGSSGMLLVSGASSYGSRREKEDPLGKIEGMDEQDETS